MTEHEQQFAMWLGECRVKKGKEHQFVKMVTYLARHDYTTQLEPKQQKRLGYLLGVYREQIAVHRGERWPVPVSFIAKGIVDGELKYYGLEAGRVVPLEAVLFYFYRAAKVPEVRLSELAGSGENPEPEVQQQLSFAA